MAQTERPFLLNPKIAWKPRPPGFKKVLPKLPYLSQPLKHLRLKRLLPLSSQRNRSRSAWKNRFHRPRPYQIGCRSLKGAPKPRPPLAQPMLSPQWIKTLRWLGSKVWLPNMAPMKRRCLSNPKSARKHHPPGCRLQPPKLPKPPSPPAKRLH